MHKTGIFIIFSFSLLSTLYGAEPMASAAAAAAALPQQPDVQDLSVPIAILKETCSNLKGSLNQLTSQEIDHAQALQAHASINELALRAIQMTEKVQLAIEPERKRRLVLPPDEPNILNCTYGLPFETQAFLSHIKKRFISIEEELKLADAAVTPINCLRHRVTAQTKAYRASHALARFFGIIAQNPEANVPYINTQKVITGHTLNDPSELYSVCTPVIRKWFNQRALAQWCNNVQPGCLQLPAQTEVQNEPYSAEILSHKIMGFAQDLYTLLICKNRHLKIHLSNLVDKLSPQENLGAQLIAQEKQKGQPEQNQAASEAASAPNTTNSPDMLDYGLDLSVWTCIKLLRLTENLHPEQAATATMLQQLYNYVKDTLETKEAKKEANGWYASGKAWAKSWAMGVGFNYTLGGNQALNQALISLHGLLARHTSTLDTIAHCGQAIKTERHRTPRERYFPKNSFSNLLTYMAEQWNSGREINLPLSSELAPERPLAAAAGQLEPHLSGHQPAQAEHNAEAAAAAAAPSDTGHS